MTENCGHILTVGDQYSLKMGAIMRYVNCIVVLCVLFLLIPIAALAGSLDDPGAPTTAGGGAMNTLEDIYNIISDGTTNAPRSGTCAEPSAGPVSTGHTLTDVYNRAKTSSRAAKTGQTLCYNASGTVITCTGTGQDGDKLKGVTWPNPRFTDNNNGTVTDNLTGLIWLKNGNCFGLRNWNTALSDCNGLASGSCGLTDGSSAGDWRLPNVKEFLSLIDWAYYNPALSNDAGTAQWTSGDAFTVAASGGYWSSTTHVYQKYNGWMVYLGNGDVEYRGKTSSFYVWPVRGGQ